MSRKPGLTASATRRSSKKATDDRLEEAIADMERDMNISRNFSTTMPRMSLTRGQVAGRAFVVLIFIALLATVIALLAEILKKPSLDDQIGDRQPQGLVDKIRNAFQKRKPANAGASAKCTSHNQCKDQMCNHGEAGCCARCIQGQCVKGEQAMGSGNSGNYCNVPLPDSRSLSFVPGNASPTPSSQVTTMNPVTATANNRTTNTTTTTTTTKRKPVPAASPNGNGEDESGTNSGAVAQTFQQVVRPGGQYDQFKRAPTTGVAAPGQGMVGPGGLGGPGVELPYVSTAYEDVNGFIREPNVPRPAQQPIFPNSPQQPVAIVPPQGLGPMVTDSGVVNLLPNQNPQMQFPFYADEFTFTTRSGCTDDRKLGPTIGGCTVNGVGTPIDNNMALIL